LDAHESLLYTNGSVDSYRTYPGLYVPRPLSLTWGAIQQAPRKLLREVLALTKMNWNTTVFANTEPITVGAARVVGDTMKAGMAGKRPAAICVTVHAFPFGLGPCSAIDYPIAP
jgi:hypothetical protein